MKFTKTLPTKVGTEFIAVWDEGAGRLNCDNFKITEGKQYLATYGIDEYAVVDMGYLERIIGKNNIKFVIQ